MSLSLSAIDSLGETIICSSCVLGIVKFEMGEESGVFEVDTVGVLLIGKTVTLWRSRVC